MHRGGKFAMWVLTKRILNKVHRTFKKLVKIEVRELNMKWGA